MPSLSIIVCTYNRADLIGFCLESLAKQSLSKNKYEVVIVDNNCTDNTSEIVIPFTKKYPNFRIIYENKQGLSHARNTGYLMARNDYIAYIDDDAKASPEWAELILTAFTRIKPQPVAIGGETIPWCEIPPPEWLGENYEYATWGDVPRFLNDDESQNGFFGMNMAFLRSALIAANGFAPNLGVVGNKLRLGEETALFRELYHLGYCDRLWYDPAIRVEHYLPKEKMKFFYIVRRCYASGKANSQLNHNRLTSVSNLVLLVNLCFMILKAPIALLRPGRSIARNAAIFCQTFASRLGRLLGCVINN